MLMTHNITCDTDTVESELFLPAMLSSSDTRYDTGGKNDWTASSTAQKEELEECMKTEGLRYFGGCIAHKYPKYSYLGTNVTPDDSPWIGEVCRNKGKPMNS